MPRMQIKKKSFNEGKLNTAIEIADFSSTFVVSEELVKIYLDHLKNFHFAKYLRNQATVEKRRNQEQGLQLGRVATIWRVKISLCYDTDLKKHSRQYKKKIEK